VISDKEQYDAIETTSYVQQQQHNINIHLYTRDIDINNDDDDDDGILVLERI